MGKGPHPFFSSEFPFEFDVSWSRKLQKYFVDIILLLSGLPMQNFMAFEIFYLIQKYKVNMNYKKYLF